MSGRDPHPDVTTDGIAVDVGGMIWWPKLDTMQVKIPPIHFGSKDRGKLKEGTKIFEGTFADLQKFCPAKMSRRVVVSKLSQPQLNCNST